MKDYSYVTVLEGVNEETACRLIDAIKTMDTQVAKGRLKFILNANGADAEFNSIVHQFMMTLGTLTSADREL